jgi:hypothetical protein
MTETATAVQPVVFASKSPNHRLVRIAKDVIRNEGGRKVAEVSPGSRHNERYGVEDDGAPWEVVFEGGLYTTEDPIIIDFLRTHAQNGVYFHEQGADDVELQPTLVEQMSRIATAAARFDVDDLQQLLNEEKDTHNREAVVQGAEAALRELADGPSQEGAGAENPGTGDQLSTSPSSPAA